jgi:glycerophosphoryl diester phosphodiesterase
VKNIHVPTNVRIKPPALIAHRGYALRYPENTLESLTAAVEARAGYVEFDVQLTADRVPVLMHDADFWRTGRIDRSVLDTTLEHIRDIWVNETARLGPEFFEVHVPTLAETADWLKAHPGVKAFVEIKRESLRKFGRADVVSRIVEGLKPVISRCAVISFDLDAVRLARERGAEGIGWVLASWDPETRAAAEGLGPEYLFCDYRMIPDDAEALWPGPWDWAFYEIVDPDLALALAAFGAKFIETMAIGEMLADLRLKPGL